MNLLPKSSEEFAQTDYWNTFFKTRGEKSFDWYGEYMELCVLLHKYVKIKDNILMIGCGNSTLSADLYDNGFKFITNIDISNIVINQMIKKHKEKRPDMHFLQMDATTMKFENDEFTVIIDKGTLDALMANDTIETKETVKNYFSQISRVLRNGGRYICISLLQEHILKFMLEYFVNNDFMFRITRCYEAEQKTAECTPDGFTMPVFVIVATKFKNLQEPLLEICLGGETMQRLSNMEEMLKSVLSVQRAAVICKGLKRGNIADLNEISIDLHQVDRDIPRYTVYILDQNPMRCNGKYAAFIVPQGREIEWLFSTPQGRKKLLKSAGQNRLAIVTMHPEHVYDSLDTVKTELTETVRNFAPLGLKEQIPFLSLGSDVGKREIIYSGSSDISGDFRIEEVEIEKQLYRRLIFLQNERVVQSEALMKITYKNKKPVKKIDLGYLACNHHLFMCIGTQLAASTNESGKCNVMVVGLGGGGLCSFIHEIIKDVNVDAVEIDRKMVEIATKYFDLSQDFRLKVIIDDGIEYLRKCCDAGTKYDAILLDVDSKDSSKAISCPPEIFLEDKTLEHVIQIIGSTGIFILNLVCRDEELRNSIIENLKLKFLSICCYKLNEDVNEIVFCKNAKLDIDNWKSNLGHSGKALNKFCKKKNITKNDLIDVNDFLTDLTIN